MSKDNGGGGDNKTECLIIIWCCELLKQNHKHFGSLFRTFDGERRICC